MKTFKTFIIAIILTTGLVCSAQSGVSVSLHQGPQFTFNGDNEAPYEDVAYSLLARFKMNSYQGDYGYVIVFPEFEYAYVDGIYKRYSANVGYTLNRLIVDNFEVSATIGWGWIDRYGKTTHSFSTSYEVAYKLTDNIKASLIGKSTQRSDLLLFWGDHKIGVTVLFGIEYKL